MNQYVHFNFLNVSEKSTKNRKFTQIHYTGWPDFGAPTNTAPITNMVKDVRKMVTMLQKTTQINILVHCSAGVGRTGTLIVLYQMMEDLDKLVPRYEQGCGNSDLSVDVFNTVLNYRSKRVHMVCV